MVVGVVGCAGSLLILGWLWLSFPAAPVPLVPVGMSHDLCCFLWGWLRGVPKLFCMVAIVQELCFESVTSVPRLEYAS